MCVCVSYQFVRCDSIELNARKVFVYRIKLSILYLAKKKVFGVNIPCSLFAFNMKTEKTEYSHKIELKPRLQIDGNGAVSFFLGLSFLLRFGATAKIHAETPRWES